MNKFWFLLSSLYGSLKEYVDEQISKGGGGGSGSGLPEVTSEDNGDILTVVDGAWAKGEPGYRAAMVDGAVIIPEQTLTPEEIESNYVAYPDLIGATVDVADWFNNNAVPETLPVTFNGVKHVTPTTEIDKSDPYSFKCWCGEVENGSPVFTNYPFCIELAYAVPDGFADVTIYVPTADSFTIKIAEEAHTAIPTEDFKLAVDNSYTQPTVTQETFWAAQSITTEAVSGKSYAAADGPVYDDDSPTPEKLNVVFDGTAYELPRVPMQIAYGAETDEGSPDFTTYPLFLHVVNTGSYLCLQLCTPQAGTYTLEATYDVSTTAPTEKFKEAVKQSGGGMQTVMFEVYYDDSGEHTPEHLIITCNKTNDELIAAEGPLFAQALLWQTNPPFNAIASMMESDDGGNTYAEFQFLTIVYESSHEELALTIIKWNGVEEKWAAEFHEFGLTPLT